MFREAKPHVSAHSNTHTHTHTQTETGRQNYQLGLTYLFMDIWSPPKIGTSLLTDCSSTVFCLCLLSGRCRNQRYLRSSFQWFLHLTTHACCYLFRLFVSHENHVNPKTDCVCDSMIVHN